jgi:plastocyanin
MVLRKRRAYLIALLAVMILPAASPTHADAKTHRVTISKMAFGPVPAGIHPGDSIEWVNADIFRHTATARDGSFDIDLMPGARAAIVLKHAQNIDFFCRYHPGMTGRLVVAK